MAIFMQICGASTVCFLSLIMGFTYNWPSSTLELFKSNNTVLSHPMEPYEIALYGSLSCVGALIGTPLSGYLLDKIGRKYSSILGGLPFLISWSIMATFNQVEVVLFSQFLAGIGGASFVISPVFSSEICQDSIRGTVTAGSMIFYGLGILFSYVMIAYLPYYTLIYILVTMTVLYMLCVVFLKDSPVYLLTVGKEEEAAKSIAFYRSVDRNTKEVLDELCNIKRLIDFETAGSLEEEKLKPEIVHSGSKEKISPIKYLWKNEPTRRALIFCLTTVTATVFMGFVVVQVYADPLFRETVPTISATSCNITFALVSIIATIVTAVVVDKAGRKMLMLYSCGASAAVTLLLGTQLHMQWGPHVLTAVLIYVFCFVFSLGAGSIPYILVYEVFLPEIKSFCSMLVLEWAWLTNFLVLLIFNPLVACLGLGPVFYIFSAFCVLTTVFCALFQPETKGLPLDVIVTLFTAPNKRASICKI